MTLEPDEVIWHVLQEGRLIPVPPDADGLYRSGAFPGLWLDPAAPFARHPPPPRRRRPWRRHSPNTPRSSPVSPPSPPPRTTLSTSCNSDCRSACINVIMDDMARLLRGVFRETRHRKSSRGRVPGQGVVTMDQGKPGREVAVSLWCEILSDCPDGLTSYPCLRCRVPAARHAPT